MGRVKVRETLAVKVDKAEWSRRFSCFWCAIPDWKRWPKLEGTPLFRSRHPGQFVAKSGAHETWCNAERPSCRRRQHEASRIGGRFMQCCAITASFPQHNVYTVETIAIKRNDSVHRSTLQTILISLASPCLGSHGSSRAVCDSFFMVNRCYQICMYLVQLSAPCRRPRWIEK